MRRACFVLFLTLVVGVGVIGSAPDTVSACSIGVVPGPPPTRDELRAEATDAFGRADAVFRGRVVAVGGVGPEAVTFQTDWWWKGTPTATVAVRAIANGCGYGFTPGEEYIVYARPSAGGLGVALEVAPGTASHRAPTTDVEDEVFGQGMPPAPTGGGIPGVGRWFDLLMGGVILVGSVGAFAVRRR